MNVLIVEDEIIAANAYANILKSVPKNNFIIKIVKNCDEAIAELKILNYQLVLLDLRIPPSSDQRYICGEDIGLFIRKTNPETKIIILSSITDALRTNSIVKEINPEGFLVKSDIEESRDLVSIVLTILNDEKIYSKTIEGYTNKVINNAIIDDFDRLILYYLSKGEKVKDIANYIPLSTRGIEARIVKLKSVFLNKSEESNLIKKAKEYGLI